MKIRHQPKQLRSDLRSLFDRAIKKMKEAFSEEFNSLMPALPVDEDGLLNLQFDKLYELLRRYDPEMFKPFTVPSE